MAGDIGGFSDVLSERMVASILKTFPDENDLRAFVDFARKPLFQRVYEVGLNFASATQGFVEQWFAERAQAMQQALDEPEVVTTFADDV